MNKLKWSTRYQYILFILFLSKICLNCQAKDTQLNINSNVFELNNEDFENGFVINNEGSANRTWIVLFYNSTENKHHTVKEFINQCSSSFNISLNLGSIDCYSKEKACSHFSQMYYPKLVIINEATAFTYEDAQNCTVLEKYIRIKEYNNPNKKHLRIEILPATAHAIKNYLNMVEKAKSDFGKEVWRIITKYKYCSSTLFLYSFVMFFVLLVTAMIYFTCQAMKNRQQLDQDENRATREEIREKFNEIKQEKLKQE